MGIRSPENVVPTNLTPAAGTIPGLTLYRDDTIPVVAVGPSNVTVDGTSFPSTGRTLPRLAAEINRAMPSVTAVAHLDTEPEENDLVMTVGDLSPDGGQIIRFDGIAAKSLETTRIRLLPPYAVMPSSAWRVRVNRGSFRTTVNGGSFLFSVPEYEAQTWSPRFGKPYMDRYRVRPNVVDSTYVRVPHQNLVWEPGLIKIYARGQKLPDSIISDVDEANGIVFLSRPLDITSEISLDYVYKETSLIYTGVDLNPTLQHSPDLAERFVLFYLVPRLSNTGVQNDKTVRHVVSHSVEGAVSLLERGVAGSTPVILLGAVRVRQVDKPKDTFVMDTRSGGGGVKQDFNPSRLQMESSFYSDIGRFDGEPYPGNAVLVTTVPRTLLETFTRDEVTRIVSRHVALGTMTIVEYE